MSSALFEKPVEPESLQEYLSEITRYPQIDRAQEAELARRTRLGEQAAMETLVVSNLRAVVSVARRYQSAGVPLSDLINSGNQGLVHAARQFDETEGVRFMSFAVWRIRQAIVQAVASPVPAASEVAQRRHAVEAGADRSPKPSLEALRSVQGRTFDRDVGIGPDEGSSGEGPVDRALSASDDLVNGARGEEREHDDTALMEGIRDGNHASLQALLTRYWGPLVTYARRFTDREDEAEDVVQETFVRVWKERARWAASGSVGAYLYRITRNLALNARRDQKAQQSRDRLGGGEMLNHSFARSPAEEFDSKAVRHEVEDAIAALPRRRREVLILSRFHGLTHQEIADTLGLSRQTVANHMGAALSDLRSALSRHLREN